MQQVNKAPHHSLPSPQSKEITYIIQIRDIKWGRGGILQSDFLSVQKIYYLLKVSAELLGAQDHSFNAQEHA